MKYFSADFLSLYKTRGFSLHILAPFLANKRRRMKYVYFFYLSEQIEYVLQIVDTGEDR